MRKLTDTKLKVKTDVDMYHFLELSTREGIFQILKICGKLADNKNIKN